MCILAFAPFSFVLLHIHNLLSEIHEAALFLNYQPLGGHAVAPGWPVGYKIGPLPRIILEQLLVIKHTNASAVERMDIHTKWG